MLIRPATPADVPAILALERQAETAAHWGEREYGALFDTETPRRIALVAAEPDASSLLGFVIARCATGEWEVENVVVAPEKRRLGIGIRMIRELLLLQAQSAGTTSVLLEVRESNLAARRLYEKLGFREQGRRSNYYHEPEEDALLLSLSIKNLRQFYLEAG